MTEPGTESSSSSQPPQPPRPPEPPLQESADPPPVPSLSDSVETLLKNPLTLLTHIKLGRSGRVSGQLILVSILCLAVFGFVVGLFSQGQEHALQQLWAAPAKITLGLLFSGLICLPSLYIFGCLSGANFKLTSAFALLIASIALSSLLLIGFTPIVWIFSQSSDSIIFMGVLLFAFWSIALFFSAGMLFKTGKLLGGKPTGHLVIWVFIFALVTLQMSTSLRPILGTAPDLLPQEKKFFLQHWTEVIDRSTEEAARSSRGWR